MVNKATIDDSDEELRVKCYSVSALNTAPSSASDTGRLGDIKFTADHIYLCVSENSWKRSALSTW